MQFDDQDERKGRYLSHKSKIMKKIAVLDYRFEEVSRSVATQTDNLHGNIVFANLHDDIETTSLKEPENFSSPLKSEEQQKPIITAQDFTRDWSKETRGLTRRTSVLEEEEELDPLEALRLRQILEKRSLEEQAHKAQESEESSHSHGASKSSDEIREASKSSDLHRNPEMASLDMMSKVLIDMKPSKKSAVLQDGHAEHGTQKDFIPMETNTEGHGNFEDGARLQYLAQKELEDIRRRAMDEALSEARSSLDLEKIKQEAKSVGYEAGFKEGEAKGFITANQKAEAIALNVKSLLFEFENLKFNIMENAQENFIELSQAICETVLDQYFSVNPEAFSKVISHAIKAGVQSDNFIIHVHPEKYEALKNVTVPGFKERLKADSALAKDEFKIDSDLTALSGNVRQMISDLLKKADLRLFETQAG